MVKDGKTHAYDMMKLPGGPDIISKGAATTTALTDAVISALT